MPVISTPMTLSAIVLPLIVLPLESLIETPIGCWRALAVDEVTGLVPWSGAPPAAGPITLPTT